VTKTTYDKCVALHPLSENQTIRFAADELSKYLQMMDPSVNVEVRRAQGEHRGDRPGINLGLFEQFGLEAAVEDPTFDDRIHVAIRPTQGAVSGLEGIIAGSNPRSVLLAAYRFLERAGCRWVRPGVDGECIPRRDVAELSVTFDDAPAYRHRGLCIEGAVSYENMAENIDWAPKAGFNSYFLEFMTPFTFFDRWYRHLNNPYKQPEALTVDTVVRFKADLEREMAKRGLTYHAVGHGWTCESLGIPGLAWEPEERELSPEVTQLLAEVDGERKLYGGIPLNTNLCYSNPAARQAIVDYAVRYVLDNPQINVLHFWFADGANNHCECENCRDTLPADFLVMLLNELDAAFGAHGIGTKIVFIAYLDLLWPPQREQLRNPGRFILLFAPISRSYSRSYDTDTTGIQLPEYRRNRLRFPANIRENLAYLREWQKHFQGDAFTYEYYFMWDHYFDPGYYETAKVLHEDVKKLKAVGLNGIISDQTQRSFFPTGFGMYVMARTLWDEHADFDTLAREYFAAAFGSDGEACRGYMARLSQLFDPPYLRGDKGAIERGEQESHLWYLGGATTGVDKEAACRLGEIPALIDGFRPIIERNRTSSEPCHAKSWEYLGYHADLTRLLAMAFEARAWGQPESARRLWAQAAEFAQRNEDALQPVLDVFEFVRTLERKFR
jgi:hypothetical protein